MFPITSGGLIDEKIFVFVGVVLSMLIISVSAALDLCICAELPSRVDLNSEFTINPYYADPDDPLEERDKINLSLAAFKPGREVEQIILFENPNHFDAVVELTDTGQHIFLLERDPNRYRLTEIRGFIKSVAWAGETGSIIPPGPGEAGSAKREDHGLRPV